MDPITIGLMALTAGGQLSSILGKKTRKAISPEWLKANFGAGAVNDELQSLFNRAINSTQGQQLMTGAAQSGQQFQTDLARQSANAGLGTGAGATGGADVFASAGAGQAVNNLQRGMKASLMQSMLPVAQQMVGDRMNAYMQGQQLQAASPYQPSPWSQIGDLAAKYGSEGLALRNTGSNVTSGTGQSNSPGSQIGGGMAPSPIKPNSPTPAPLGPYSMNTPNMDSLQGQIRPSRFMSKMSRFSGMPGAVQRMPAYA